MTAGPTFSTVAGGVPAQDQREAGGEGARELALADLRVDGVDAGRVVADEHEVRAHGRRLDLRLVQRLGPTPLVDDHRVHQEVRTRLNTSAVSESTRSRKSRPSRWSISCCRQRASKPSETMRRSPASTSMRGRPAHVRGQVGDAQAALAADLGSLGGDDARVHQHEAPVRARRLAVSADVDDHDPKHLTQLRGRQPDAVAEGVHRVLEVPRTRAISPASWTSLATSLSAGCG